MKSQVDRASAIILAKSISDRKEILKMQGDMEMYVGRLANCQTFSVGEIAEISGLSEYQVRKTAPPESMLRAKTGIFARHLDHAIRMVGDPEFSRIHTKSLINDGATFSALARVTGQSESSLRRWAREE